MAGTARGRSSALEQVPPPRAGSPAGRGAGRALLGGDGRRAPVRAPPAARRDGGLGDGAPRRALGAAPGARGPLLCSLGAGRRSAAPLLARRAPLRAVAAREGGG